jgi:hypothetical protein
MTTDSDTDTDIDTEYFPMEGELKEGDIFHILYHIYKNSISGLLILKVETDGYEKQMVIEDRKIVFALSSLKQDAFGTHLLKHNIIDEDTYNKTNRYMEKNKKRFGRALIELGYLNYDQIWKWIQDHLKTIIYSFFSIKSGKYLVLANQKRDIENIVLDMDIITVIVEGMRRFKSNEFLEKKFETIENLYVCNTKMVTQMDLKSYENHVLDLVKRNSKLDDIITRSELLRFDTLRLLYLFLVLEVISTKPGVGAVETEPESVMEMENIVGLSTFTSFEEALKHYNMKFELIYKTLSKEIGPVALSLLLKAIEDIMENLPSYFQKIQLNSDGRIDENTVLKLVWYHDFNKNIGRFLRGLEEILYTEIYTVKKHLGIEYEQQVLKWINGIGN